MRILVTIPHFFRPDGIGRYGSTRKDPRPRLVALATAIHALHQHFGVAQGMIDVGKRELKPVNDGQRHQVDIVVCTTGGQHLLAQIGPTERLIEHRATVAEPMLLGFECHAILRDRFEDYDYVCFMEDDLIHHDPWFFRKLKWFGDLAGPECLLLPNRFETAGQIGTCHKAYIDGDLLPRVTAGLQDVNDQSECVAEFLGSQLTLRRPLNPHSGCFFLSRDQMRHWTRQSYFLDRDSRFVGPLESAASLGIMQTFRVYKPAPENASFLEIQHFGTGFIGLIGNQVKVGAAFTATDDQPRL